MDLGWYFGYFRRSDGVPIPAGAVPPTATGRHGDRLRGRGTRRRESPGVPALQNMSQGLASAVRVGRGGPGEHSGSHAGGLEKVRFF